MGAQIIPDLFIVHSGIDDRRPVSFMGKKFADWDCVIGDRVVGERGVKSKARRHEL